MTATEALAFFADAAVCARLQPLVDVGSTTCAWGSRCRLERGEAQRLKLAAIWPRRHSAARARARQE